MATESVLPVYVLMAMKVVVACGEVKLKLTLTEELLDKSLEDALVGPFISAYNKKAGTSLKPADLLGFSVDGGSEMSDLSLSARTVLTHHLAKEEVPKVTLRAPPPPDAGPTDALIGALCEPPADATPDARRDAIRALRLAILEEGAVKPSALFEPKLVGLVADHACLSAESAAASREWAPDAAEACLLLLALLRLGHGPTGETLCSPGVGALQQVIAVLSGAQALPPLRVRYVAQVAFHLSLLPAVGGAAGALTEAARCALSWAVDALVAGGGDEVLLAGTAADVVRAQFNLLRTSPPDLASEEGREACGAIISSVRALLRTKGEVAELAEAKLASLQLPVVMPKEIGFVPLAQDWSAVLDVLRPLLEDANLRDANLDAPVVPLVVLQNLAEASAEARDALKARH